MNFDFFTWFFDEAWGSVHEAPVPFILAVIAVVLFVWATMQWGYGRAYDVLKERYESEKALKEEYREKLKGASPEEAKKQMEALEAKVAQLQPPRLSDDKRQAFASRLSGSRGSVEILTHNLSGPVRLLVSDLVAIFRETGWKVENDSLISSGAGIAPGLTIFVKDQVNLSPAAQSALNAVIASSLPYTLKSWPEIPRDVRIIVTAP